MGSSYVLTAQNIFPFTVLGETDASSHAVRNSHKDLKCHTRNRHTTLLQGRHIQRSNEGCRRWLTVIFPSFG